jgi:hypothetical protein
VRDAVLRDRLLERGSDGVLTDEVGEALRSILACEG